MALPLHHGHRLLVAPGVDVPGDHGGAQPRELEAHEPADARAAAGDEHHLARDVLLEHGGGEAELHQLLQAVVARHQEPEDDAHEGEEVLVVECVQVHLHCPTVRLRVPRLNCVTPGAKIPAVD